MSCEDVVLPLPMAKAILKVLKNKAILPHLEVGEVLETPEIIAYLTREANLETKTLYACVWTIEDVVGMAESEGICEDDLPEETARKTLVRALNTHDAGVGINWDSLQCDLEAVMEEE